MASREEWFGVILTVCSSIDIVGKPSVTFSLGWKMQCLPPQMEGTALKVTPSKSDYSPKKLLLIAFSSLVSLYCFGQNIPIDATSDGKADSGYQTRWDSNHKRLVLFRDTSSADLPAARLFKLDGTSTPIYILRDFRDAKFADVWAAASTPEGGTVISVILGFGERPNIKDKEKSIPMVKSFLLTYDAEGVLRRAWNVAPYHHQALAVDDAGNVFALGTRDAGKEGFPMIIKYSSSGKVLGEFLQSGGFAKGSHVIDGEPLNGGSNLFIRNQQLLLWLPSTREVLGFSLAVDLQFKIPVGRLVDRLAQQRGYLDASIATMAASSTGDIEAEVRFWQESKSTKGAMSGLVVISRDGTDAKLAAPLAEMAGNTRQFLGVGDNDKPIVLEHADRSHAVVKRQE